MDSLAHNLFLLMLNLAQLSKRERVLAIFMEAIEDLFPGAGLVYYPPSARPPTFSFEISTPHTSLGWFELPGDAQRFTKEQLALLGNAVSMLSVILENRIQAEQLSTRVEAQVIVQREVESALHESENRFQTMWNVTADAMALADRAGVVLAANPAFTRLSGFPPEKIIGRPFDELILPERRTELAIQFQSLFAGTDESQVELNFNRENGQPVTLEMHVVFFTRNGQREALLATIRDISERKQAEVRLRQALTEKETLLRELYHRTGNNMQVICSMLNLRSEYSDNAAVQRVCREIENRIHSMALVHHKLYQSSSLSDVELDIYIQELSLYLLQTRRGMASRIHIDNDLDPVSVQIDVAIPVGLILSELISNALDHAFLDSSKGQITVRLTDQPGDYLLLTVSDNGSGPPPGLNFEVAETIGLQTVRALGEHQLHGVVTFDHSPGHGVSCTVRFRKRLYGARL